jgi:guanine deaminase
MDQRFMRQAIQLAIENVRSGRGGPFAAVVVRDGEALAWGTNLVTSTYDPTAHAEIVAIREACRTLGHFQLTGCEIYTSCEPCPMCLGAIYWARPERIFFGATYSDAAETGFDDSFIYQQTRLPAAERKIRMIPLLRDEALEAFREWERKTDKIPY